MSRPAFESAPRRNRGHAGKVAHQRTYEIIKCNLSKEVIEINDVLKERRSRNTRKPIASLMHLSRTPSAASEETGSSWDNMLAKVVRTILMQLSPPWSDLAKWRVQERLDLERK